MKDNIATQTLLQSCNPNGLWLYHMPRPPGLTASWSICACTGARCTPALLPALHPVRITAAGHCYYPLSPAYTCQSIRSRPNYGTHKPQARAQERTSVVDAWRYVCVGGRGGGW